MLGLLGAHPGQQGHHLVDAAQRHGLQGRVGRADQERREGVVGLPEVGAEQREGVVELVGPHRDERIPERLDDGGSQDARDPLGVLTLAGGAGVGPDLLGGLLEFPRGICGRRLRPVGENADDRGGLCHARNPSRYLAH